MGEQQDPETGTGYGGGQPDSGANTGSRCRLPLRRVSPQVLRSNAFANWRTCGVPKTGGLRVIWVLI